MEFLDGHWGFITCRCRIDPAVTLIDDREEKETL